MKVLYELDKLFGLYVGLGLLAWVVCIIGLFVYIGIKAYKDEEFTSDVKEQLRNMVPGSDEPLTAWDLTKALMLWPIVIPYTISVAITVVQRVEQQRELYREE